MKNNLSTRLYAKDIAPKKIVGLFILVFTFFLSSTSFFAQIVTTFSYTGAMQTYTVPSNVYFLQLELWGSQGSDTQISIPNYSSAGGLGGYVKGIFTVTPGQVLTVAVGGTTGFNGGGLKNGTSKSGSGGGATDVRVGGTGLSNRIAVAGGGGGAGITDCSNTNGGGAGGYPGGGGGSGRGIASSSGSVSGGGVPIGVIGASSSCTASMRGGGGGGQDGGGGQGGVSSSTGGSNGGCGGPNGNIGIGSSGCTGSNAGGGCFGVGGAGGSSSNTACTNLEGGGGGGGWYGGGGGGGRATSTTSNSLGGYITSTGSGGGGGSSYLGTLFLPSYSNGIQSGNGLAKISTILTATVSKTNVSCNGLSDGSATVTALSSYTSVSYSWSPSGGNSSVASGLVPGNYTCTVTDPTGAFTKVAVTINQPAILNATGTGTNVTCFGGTNGSAAITISGGNAPYSFTWSPASSSVSSNNPITNLSAGIYTCSVKDASNCVLQKTVNVTQASTFAIGGFASNPAVCPGFTTSLHGTGASTYTWSGGQTNGTAFTPSVTETYSVSGTNSLGCLGEPSVVNVTVYPTPTITVNSGAICAGQLFTLVASGASSYTYSSGSILVFPLTSTTYTVFGTSNFGCAGIPGVSSVTVNQLPVISVSSGSMCQGSSFTLSPSGAATYSYSGGSAVVSPSSTSSFTVSGISAEGCASANQAVATITVINAPTVSVNSGSICSGESFTINPTVNGASSYSISGGASVVNPSITSAYTISAINSEGCTSESISTVSVFPPPQVSVNSGSICSGDPFILQASGAFTYTYSSGSATVNPTSTSSYSVTGANAQGCISSNTAISTVVVYALPSVSVASSPELICAGEQASLSASGAQSYSWSTGSTNNQIVVSPSVSTTYSLSGTDANGCSMQVVMTQSVSECLGLKTNEVSSLVEVFTVFPNPSSGSVVVMARENLQIFIYSQTGQLLDTRLLDSYNKHRVSLGFLQPGIYFISSNGSTPLTKKIVVMSN